RKNEIENECNRQTQALDEATLRLRRQEQDLLAARGTLEAREQVWRDGQQELERLREQLANSGELTSKQAEEVLTWRRELSTLKQEMTQRLRARKEKLVKQTQAVRRAALRVQQRKHETDA